MALLELRGVTRHFEIPDQVEPLEILKGVDLTVSEGDRISIIGRSGSGKSTLLNIMGLLDAPSSGDVFYQGKLINKIGALGRDKIRARDIGFVFQQFNLLHGRSALDNVIMPLLYGESGKFWSRRKLATEVLHQVGLGDRLNHRVNQLSGGEQQRVAIARALVKKPRLIFSDEPTGALDIETGETVMSLLERVARENNAALVTITHDVGIAARSDVHYRLVDGVLAEVAAHELQKVAIA
ncbi:MAG: ABC transporter ATP-binding protein [Microbacteriaceae bacterium]